MNHSKCLKLRVLFLAACWAALGVQAVSTHGDERGVLRWSDSNKEVNTFGNDSASAALTKKYLKHLAMYEGKTGYPLVSVLPDPISTKCVEKTGAYLWRYAKGSRNIISDFHD